MQDPTPEPVAISKSLNTSQQHKTWRQQLSSFLKLDRPTAAGLSGDWSQILPNSVYGRAIKQTVIGVKRSLSSATQLRLPLALLTSLWHQESSTLYVFAPLSDHISRATCSSLAAHRLTPTHYEEPASCSGMRSGTWGKPLYRWHGIWYLGTTHSDWCWKDNPGGCSWFSKPGGPIPTRVW